MGAEDAGGDTAGEPQSQSWEDTQGRFLVTWRKKRHCLWSMQFSSIRDAVLPRGNMAQHQVKGVKFSGEKDTGDLQLLSCLVRDMEA